MRIESLKELQKFAETFLAENPQGACVGLSGDLGAGKTTFVRHCIELIARRSDVKMPRVTSPSYVLHQSYPFLKPLVDHFDLYRLENLDSPALTELGYFDALNANRAHGGFLFVEWPEKATRLDLLELQIHLAFTVDTATGYREIVIL